VSARAGVSSESSTKERSASKHCYMIADMTQFFLNCWIEDFIFLLAISQTASSVPYYHSLDLKDSSKVHVLKT
jgi:hypothetical protein